MSEEMDRCGCNSGPMTVRELIHQLMVESPSLDSVVSCTVLSGSNMVAFAPIGVDDVSCNGDEKGHVCIAMGQPYAWDVETNATLDAGVLTLENS